MGCPDTSAALENRRTSHVDQTVAHEAYLDPAAARVKQRRLRLFERLWLQPCAVALGAGSGIGDTTIMLAELVGPYGRAVAIDRSAKLVERARRRTKDVANVA